MNRRELLRQALGGLALGIAPIGAALASTSLRPASNPHSEFDQLLDEAHAALSNQDLGRAFNLYSQALKNIPEALPNSKRADALEGFQTTQQLLKSARGAVERHRAAGQEDAEAHYWFGFALMRCSRNEEALHKFELAGRLNPESVSEWCLCLGACHYREGRYQEALQWFEKVQLKTDGLNSVREFSEHYQALEYRLLIYARLGLREKARAAVLEHLQHHGRVGEHVSRALRKIGIDADALYIQHVTVG